MVSNIDPAKEDQGKLMGQSMFDRCLGEFRAFLWDRVRSSSEPKQSAIH